MTDERTSDRIIHCRGVGRTFREGPRDTRVLDGIDLAVGQGEQVAIVGRSGSGKSTLLQILGGLDTPSEGAVEVAGRDVHTLSARERGVLRNRAVGFIYQFHHLLPEFTAEENVAMPLLIRGTSARQAQALAAGALAQVGLEHRTGHKPGELSGGERQRTAIARALVTEPACVLADEPTGNLDRQTAEDVFAVLQALNRSIGTSLVLVTHDMELARRMDRVITIDDGRLVDTPDGPVSPGPSFEPDADADAAGC